MSKRNRVGLFMFLGLCFGSLVGFLNTLTSQQNEIEMNSDLKAISHDIRETLSRDKGCTEAMATTLVYRSRKTTNRAFKVDGFKMPNGEQLVIGDYLEKYSLKVDDLSIKELNSIGKNNKGYEVFTAKLSAVFISDKMFGKKEERMLSQLLLTLDNRDRLVQCSNRFSGDAITMMVSLCKGSGQSYDRESGHCRSPRAMAKQVRGISSVK